MLLTKQRQIETGAFYTPKIWAEKAFQYIEKHVSGLEDFLFYDPAAGEGSLLEVLPDYCNRYATTLENEDVLILRKKGIVSNQFDFLNDDINNLLELKEKNIIVFTNPPFVKLPANNNSYAKQKYKNNDAVALFYYRIFFELEPCFLASFSKCDVLQAKNFAKFRKDTNLYQRFIDGFVSHSRTWNLEGDWPILFAIYF